MRTLFFEQTEHSSEGKTDWSVPAGGERLFWGTAIVPMLLKGVRLVTSSGWRPLKAAALLLPDIGIDTVDGCRSFPIEGGIIEGVRPIQIAEPFYVRIENPSTDPHEVHPVALARVSFNQERPSFRFDFAVPLAPKPTVATSRRLRLPAKSTREFHLHSPFDCRIRRITMRSNSELDVRVVALQLANMCLISDPVPVELFHGGLDFETFPVTPSNKLGVALINESDADRYVEIDVGVAPTPEAKGESAACP